MKVDLPLTKIIKLIFKDITYVKYVNFEKLSNSDLLKIVAVTARAMQYIKNPSEQLQLAAVKQNGYIIEYIKNPSEKVQLEAVKQNAYAIFYIKNPSEKMQLLSFNQDPDNFYLIKRPCKKLLDLMAIREVLE